MRPAKIMTHFTSLFGLPPYANLTLVETEAGSPNGYAAPGFVFLAPGANRGTRANSKVLANEISRQWWEELVSPVTRNHLWLENGLATYSELLWTEHSSERRRHGSPAAQRNGAALTSDNVPVIQAGRLEDYSPELWALTGSKGAAVLNMLRPCDGRRQVFPRRLKNFAKENTWKSVSTDDFARRRRGSRRQQSLGLFLHSVDRIERRAGVQAGLHGFFASPRVFA